MSPAILVAIVLAYFALLFWVARRTGHHATNEGFFVGNRRSPWLLVAFGMVGTTLSGVTFVSVPGAVGRDAFTYFQIILGHFFGYLVIAFVLLPLYYRDGVTSIYHLLATRLGKGAHRTGAAFFILSRTLGATARLYLVVAILQATLLDAMGVPFALTAAVILGLIVAYTFEGGVKTLVWTDLLQTACMLGGLVVVTLVMLDRLDLTFAQSLERLSEAGLSRVFATDPEARNWVGKHLVAGAFIAIAMAGMDQEMMQKNISVRRLADSQKNVVLLAALMMGVVLLFLYLGGLLHLFAPAAGVTAQGDRLFPAVVMQELPAAVQLVFFIALVSALFPSADGALTALTSSFCIDLLGLQERKEIGEAAKKRIRQRVHIAFAAVFLALVLGFHALGNPSMINVILKVAAFTYGPLLGLFAFAIFARRRPVDRLVPVVAILAPLICLYVDRNQAALFGTWEVGLEILVLNGAITFAGLWLCSRPAARARYVKGFGTTDEHG
ncbi:MAG: sodium:solute symporter [Betaproteobacteria bacterium]|nr:sodium:solute symporter [Betaproteobacteria bacterium]